MKNIIYVVFMYVAISPIFALEEASENIIKKLGISEKEAQLIDDLAENFDEEIILISGLYRGLFPNNFSIEIEVIETKDKVENSRSSVKSYVRLQDSGKSWASLSIITTEGGQAPRRILQDGTSLWFHQKGVSRAIRISPAQKLLGGASYADVASTNYFYDYAVSAREETSIGDTKSYAITLTPRGKGVAYASIQYWVSASDFRPIKSEFFARSGRKLKTMYFRKFKNISSRIISTEWVIVDGLNESLVTYLTLEAVQVDALPERYYNYSALPDLP